MMKQVCDHCGNDDGTAKQAGFKRGEGNVIEKDLCDECSDKVRAFFAPRVPRKRESKPAAKG